MSGWLITAAYVLTWLVATVIMAKVATPFRKRCHGEPRNTYTTVWSLRSSCIAYDRPGCWRADDEVTMSTFAVSAIAAIVWPLTLLVLGAYVAATHQPRRVDLAAIERMEREAGIR